MEGRARPKSSLSKSFIGTYWQAIYSRATANLKHILELRHGSGKQSM